MAIANVYVFSLECPLVASGHGSENFHSDRIRLATPQPWVVETNISVDSHRIIVRRALVIPPQGVFEKLRLAMFGKIANGRSLPN
jgi:hypothetical protein